MSEQQPHPMVAVPDAIRTVLRETAYVILQQQQQKGLNTNDNASAKISTVHLNEKDCWKQLQNQIVANDVYSSNVGYPPYNASIMDGYAIQIKNDNINNNNVDDNDSWTHFVLDKVFAGDLNVQERIDNKNTNSSSSNNGNDDDNDDKKQQLSPALYVTTGAIVPEPYNCVVPIEECVISPDDDNKDDNVSPRKMIRIPTGSSQKGKWIRPIGCDIPPQSLVLSKGQRLDPVSIGLLYQSGIDQVEIIANNNNNNNTKPIMKQKKMITIGVLSTGNELLQFPTATNQNKEGKIPDVNRPILLSLLSSMVMNHNTTSQQHDGPNTNNTMEFNVIDLGMERDDNIDSLTQTLHDASLKCDVIITTGGISMGESDKLEYVLVTKLKATLHFGRLHMKPGKPTTFCTIPSTTSDKSSCLVFAMPGNPVSACVCTHLLVQPCIQLLHRYCYHSHHDESDPDIHGESAAEMIDRMIENANVLHVEQQVTLTHDIKLDMERPEYHRVRLSSSSSSSSSSSRVWEATSTGTQRSSRLMSMMHADGLLVLPQGTKEKPKAYQGETYTVLRLFNTNNQGRFAMEDGISMQHSKHLASSCTTGTAIQATKDNGKEFTVHIVTVIPPNTVSTNRPSLSDISKRLESSFSGTRSGTIKVVKETELQFGNGDHDGDYDWKSLVESIQLTTTTTDDGNVVDIDFSILVVLDNGNNDCNFTFSLDLSSKLREHPMMTKINDTLALQARRGAASQNPTCGLFEILVGYVVAQQEPQEAQSECKKGSMLVLVPESGLDGALKNVRGLLKHALKVARGKTGNNSGGNHNHHNPH